MAIEAPPRKLSRRHVLAWSTLAACGLARGPAAAQSAWPSQPIKLVVPFAAGGGGDALGRLLADGLRGVFSQTIVVENKPGASTIIASEYVARAAPDGYTILLNNQALLLNAFLNDTLPYKPLEDFVPVVEMVKAQLWMGVSTVRTDATTVAELIAHMKRDPLMRFYASASNGSLGHLMGFNLGETVGLNLQHVLYKGATPAATDLAAGQIPMAILDLAGIKPMVDAGKVRLIAVSGSARSKAVPQVPTFGESGYPGFTTYSWAGLFMPAKTPPDVVRRVAEETMKMLAQPAVIDKLRTLGYDPGTLTETRFAELARADSAQLGALIKRSGLK